MIKRLILTGAAVIICLVTIGCTGQTQSVSEPGVLAQDIYIGADSAPEPVESAAPAGLPESGDESLKTLSDEMAALQRRIDALNEKIANLEWLRGSYIEENPSDIDIKLAQCDDLIAQAKAELRGLQEKMTLNDNNRKLLSGNETARQPDIVPEEPDSSWESADLPSAMPTVTVQ